MKELRDAVLAVLNSASNEGCDGCYVVDAKALWVLQEEFNIHFVEPENPQIAVIDKP